MRPVSVKVAVLTSECTEFFRRPRNRPWTAGSTSEVTAE